jgi:hypothetical protein
VNGDAWAIVCDGMGGVSGGQIASALCVEKAAAVIRKGYRNRMSVKSVKNLLESAISAANAVVFEKSLKDCELKGYGAYNTDKGGGYSQSVPSHYTGAEIINSGYSSSDAEYLDWDFGYTCYMPKTMYIDNFKCGIKDVAVFSKILDAAFADTSSNKYVITSSITYKNMHSLKTVADEIACPVLASIPVINETYPEE